VAIGVRVGPALQAWESLDRLRVAVRLGIKMLLTAAPPNSTSRSNRDPFDLRVLVVLGVATSIDALAVGVPLPMLNAPPCSRSPRSA